MVWVFYSKGIAHSEHGNIHSSSHKKSNTFCLPSIPGFCPPKFSGVVSPGECCLQLKTLSCTEFLFLSNYRGLLQRWLHLHGGCVRSDWVTQCAKLSEENVLPF